MKIIQVHNYYQQAGGEDAVVEAERALLEAKGNIIIPFYKSNDDISGGQRSEDGGRKSIFSRLSSVFSLLRVSAQTIWNHQTYREFRKLLQVEKPDVVHCHNTFPLISPSIYWACAKEKIPVVQTLHNFRLACASPFFFRDGKICEQCIGKIFPYPALRYRCYRKSFAGSTVWACMVCMHRLIGTYRNKVDRYIALTDFVQEKLVECGLPRDKISVKPNFIDDSSIKERSAVSSQQSEQTSTTNHQSPTPYCLFVGRLSSEKGCDVLIRAWGLYEQKSEINSQMSDKNSPFSDHCSSSSANNKKPQLFIVGDGPERSTLEVLSSDLCPSTSVRFLGKLPKNEVLDLMHNANFLVSSSLCYETFGLVVLEAGMQETASLVVAHGALKDIVCDHKTGLLYASASIKGLADKIEWSFAHSVELRQMGKNARDNFEKNYSTDVNYQQMIDIYNREIND